MVVTFAVDQEFAPWRRVREFKRLVQGELSVWEGQVGLARVRVGITGMGMQHAARATLLLLADGADACISAGLAGGLRPEHQTGRILTARTVRAGVGDTPVGSDNQLRRAAAIQGARVVDAFYSSERVLLTAKEKAALGLLADAVEMEGYAVLSEARRWHVPGVAVRAVSDPATMDLPVDFNRAIGRRGNLSLPRLLAQIARRPKRLPELMRLGKHSRRAAMGLAVFLDSYLAALGEQWHAPAGGGLWNSKAAAG